MRVRVTSTRNELIPRIFSPTHLFLFFWYNRWPRKSGWWTMGESSLGVVIFSPIRARWGRSVLLSKANRPCRLLITCFEVIFIGRQGKERKTERTFLLSEWRVRQGMDECDVGYTPPHVVLSVRWLIDCCVFGVPIVSFDFMCEPKPNDEREDFCLGWLAHCYHFCLVKSLFWRRESCTNGLYLGRPRSWLFLSFPVFSRFCFFVSCFKCSTSQYVWCNDFIRDCNRWLKKEEI